MSFPTDGFVTGIVVPPFLFQDLDLSRQKYGGLVLGLIDDQIASFGMDPSKEVRGC